MFSCFKTKVYSLVGPVKKFTKQLPELTSGRDNASASTLHYFGRYSGLAYVLGKKKQNSLDTKLNLAFIEVLKAINIIRKKPIMQTPNEEQCCKSTRRQDVRSFRR